RLVPGQSTVARAADEDVRLGGKGVRRHGCRQAQVGDQPDVVPGVEGDRGVAHPLVLARRAREGRGPGQEALVPGVATVERGGEADVAGAAGEEAARLKGGDD